MRGDAPVGAPVGAPSAATLTAGELRARLPRVWPAFFAVHGSFTEAQLRSMPTILSGRDVLLSAATATGKTEAAVAPLLERHLLVRRRDAAAGLRVLYLCPTRALVRDMFERLRAPLERLGVSAGMKSGDTGPVPSGAPPSLLITTPESLDALLTRAPRVLATLRAVVLDEIHLFDDDPRGDHLRCLLRRVERVRSYDRAATGSRIGAGGVAVAHAGPTGSAPTVSPRRLQRVALSATVPDACGVAARYLDDPVVIDVRGGRQLEAEIRPLETLGVLAAALAERGAAKTLVFCNTRNEVEQTASFLSGRLGYEAEVFVHYSNLDASLRRAVEERFAAANVAVCVASSTLELGIDIGSIDDVVLLGPPSTPSSFLQRVGRGGRRGATTRVLCLARSSREHLRFQALVGLADRPEGGALATPADLGGAGLPPRAVAFRPSVLVQQVFSLLKQSPTGGVRFADLRRLAPDEVSDATLQAILEHLTVTGHLRAWRLGEWRPGERLAELADAHEIYANIGGEAQGATIVDAYSGRTIARTTRPRVAGETLLMGGRPVEVAWHDRFTFGVNRGTRPADEVLRFRTAPQAVPLELAQGVAAQLGLAPGHLYALEDADRNWLFHFWGDVYGALLAALLRTQSSDDDDATVPRGVRARNELCLRLPEALAALPPWDPHLTAAAAHELLPRLAPQLRLGRFQPLLPPTVATRSALEQLDPPRFEALYRAARVVTAPAALRERLLALA
jgi:ATP-dependent helicase Lhr and Lhr-like helicase